MFDRSKPSIEGLDDTFMIKLNKKIRKKKILSCLVLRNEKLVFKYYKNKKNENNLQRINSCTKSFISALFGILIKQGLIKDLHTPIVEFFPKLINKQSDIRKKEITIYHLLTMTPGFYWPEFGKWDNFAKMQYSSDMIKFIINRPLESSPGEYMNYNSGCSHLLSAIIQKVSKVSTYDFSKKYLFRPLGINNSFWYDRKNINLGADGLKIQSRDMLKFGYLYLKKGSLNGKEIIPKKWVEKSTDIHFKGYDNIGDYGYHWWISKGKEYYFSLGYGGQFIIVSPKYNLVVVFTSRMYDDSLVPLKYFNEYILPSVKG
ncbi:MAG: serine hydrolase [Firmicutes bacterium]|nr:serine hydrolase [Bacillota bacterium]